MQSAVRRLLSHSSRHNFGAQFRHGLYQVEGGCSLLPSSRSYVLGEGLTKGLGMSQKLPAFYSTKGSWNSSFQQLSRNLLDLKRFQRAFKHSLSSKLSESIRNIRLHSFRSSNAVLLNLICANLAVFMLWKIADQRFMMDNFVLSLDNLQKGRFHTIITSSFSHVSADHIFVNMLGLYIFGSEIGNLFGGTFLWKLYLAGAIGGSIAVLLNNAFIQPWLQGLPRSYYHYKSALGASDSMTAVMLLHVFLFPKAVHYLYFLIPIPGALVAAIVIGTDLWAVKEGDSQISGAGHLGGAFVAALAWAKMRRPWL
eukprot:TRINITY_DN13220_c0_g1_i2.p1 TRINITY_DN13220_c0_g1~~TRINITY_DN13220_c0_g1_i2.p1  ORF type:complete len:311 (+),score=35.02 TRINITY_DN13220_c0_g1_i2:244-1176(+)